MRGLVAVSQASKLPGKRSRLATILSRTDILSLHPSDAVGTNYKGREFYRSFATKPDQLHIDRHCARFDSKTAEHVTNL